MMKATARLKATVVAMLAVCVGFPALAQNPRVPPTDEQSPEWQLAFGGKLYDNWFMALLADPPMEIHPLVPEGVAISAANSWRCVTCHGWDYRGSVLQGHSRRLEVGPLNRAAREPVDIARVLRDQRHGYDSELISDDALALLARFVVEGQHDVARFYDPATFAGLGDWQRGRVIYQSVCLSCHGIDGRAYIEGEPGDQPALGWLARSRVAQVVHKIRNGQPGSDMVSLRFLDEPWIVDLLAYLQLLPDP